MTAEELLIHELALKAGVSVRTIRFYIEEGLLPQPDYQGKYSYYKPSYLDRLELIRRLKESYLPLREIREIMVSLSDQDVRRKLQEPLPSPKFSSEPKPAQPAARPGARAMEYIDRVMEDQSRYKTKGSIEQKQPKLEKIEDRFFQSGINAPPAPAQEENETWQRISFVPGVELHLRRPMPPAIEFKVNQLINFAKRIFHVNPKEGSNEPKFTQHTSKSG